MARMIGEERPLHNGSKKDEYSEVQGRHRRWQVKDGHAEEAKELSKSQIAIQESLLLLPALTGVSVIFCGVQSEGDCKSTNAISAKAGRTIVIWSCPRDSNPKSITSTALKEEKQ